MSSLLVHDMDTPWISSDAARLTVTADAALTHGAGAASNRLVAGPGAAGVFAEHVPAVPLDLGGYEELRLWIRADRAGDGSADRPFYLEFSYQDAGDAPGDEHRWFLPVNVADGWEHRRIGIGGDRRDAITRFRVTARTATPFSCNLDELLAVREEMLTDVERALADHLAGVSLAGVTGVALDTDANPGDTQLVLDHVGGFHPGNRVRLDDGAGGTEEHAIAAVTLNSAAGTTTLVLDAGEQVEAAYPAAGSTVTLLVPVLFLSPPGPVPGVSPAILVTYMEAHEDFERTPFVPQRDSFRPRGGRMVCSVRPSARGYRLDYQVAAFAPDRAQQRQIQEHVLRRLSADRGLRINGAHAPVWLLTATELEAHRPSEATPLYLRIGTRMETAPRQEHVWARLGELLVAQTTAPSDTETISIAP